MDFQVLDGILMPYVFIILIALGGVLLAGCDSGRPTRFWHRIALADEFTAKDKTPHYHWQDYIEQETRVFGELQKVLEDHTYLGAYRYELDSPINPLNHPHNWNRSLLLKPQRVRGGIVMLHGLSDSPYSVRSLALRFQQQGYYVIAPRLPGHGTLPTGLLNAEWEDWAAVTELAMKEMQRLLESPPGGQPSDPLGNTGKIYLLGYSSGAAIAVNYALDALKNRALPQPQKLILLSPMFGVSKFARFGRSLELISRLPLLGERRWLNLAPEYNPFKYNSFAVNAGWQAHRLTHYLRFKIHAAKTLSSLENFPPTIAFQSLVDSTVSTASVERHFFRSLPNNGSELVIFDINRHRNLEPLLRTDNDEILIDLFSRPTANYHLTKVSNRNRDTFEVSEWRRIAGSANIGERPLSLEFPRGVYSLSHIALPFPLNDPTYGLTPDEEEFFGIRLGDLDLRGEKNTLVIAAYTSQRLNSNPFYEYMTARMDEWLQD